MLQDSRARREQMREAVRRARAAESDKARHVRLARDQASHRRARDEGRGQRVVRQARDLRQLWHWRPSNQPFLTDSRHMPGYGNLNQHTGGFMMETEKHIELNSTSTTLFNSVPFCFSCEELFADRLWLEEHVCPAMTYICSCGTEFSDYMDMIKHSKVHEPGQSVLHHSTIQRRRAETQQKEQEQLRSFDGPANMKQDPLPVPVLSAPLLIAPWLAAPKAPSVPTMDLWALYQPVVVIETLRRFDRENPFQCGTCEQGFRSRSDLIKHHSFHIRQRVIGCLQCGMLLPTNKSGSDPHVCHSSSTVTLTDRVTTAPKAMVTTALNATITTAPKAAITTAPSLLNNRNPLAFENKIASPKVAQVHTLLKHQACENAADQAPWRGGYLCMMCQIPFQSVLLLQRHKCAVAADYEKGQALMPNNHKRLKRLSRPYTLPQNVDRGLAANRQVSRDVAYQDKAVGPDRAVVKMEEDSDNDCYVIEDSSSEPSQLFKNPNVSPLPVIKT